MESDNLYSLVFLECERLREDNRRLTRALAEAESALEEMRTHPVYQIKKEE